MGTTTKPAIKLEDFENEIARLAKTFDKKEFSNGFTKEAGKILLQSVEDSFVKQEGADGLKWVSPSSDRKFGGRFASSYKKRPSGKKVTSGSKRLQDTGAFRRSWRIKLTAYNKVYVAPFSNRGLTIALAAKEKWHNLIGGIGRRQKKQLDDLMKKYLRKKAIHG